MLAGRHQPGSEEAVVVCFPCASRPAASALPQGSGFSVEALDRGSLSAGYCLAISRHAGADQAIFAIMVTDLLSLIEEPEATGQEILYSVLDRIADWQEFMRTPARGRLSPEEELGLFGELLVLRELLQARVPEGRSVRAWTGPARGVHDFTFGRGAIEVKTAVQGLAFRARIGSLEQLDEHVASPLFLGAVTVAQAAGGATLPALAADLRAMLAADSDAQALYDARVLRAGLQESMASSYDRTFVHVESVFLPVNDGFPRLVPQNVPAGVSAVRYELTLDLGRFERAPLTVALAQLGVARHGA